MATKTPSKKATKKTVKKVIKTVAPDPKVVMAARNKYRSGPKLPKARKAGGAAGTGNS